MCTKFFPSTKMQRTYPATSSDIYSTIKSIDPSISTLVAIEHIQSASSFSLQHIGQVLILDRVSKLVFPTIPAQQQKIAFNVLLIIWDSPHLLGSARLAHLEKLAVINSNGHPMDLKPQECKHVLPFSLYDRLDSMEVTSISSITSKSSTNKSNNDSSSSRSSSNRSYSRVVQEDISTINNNKKQTSVKVYNHNENQSEQLSTISASNQLVPSMTDMFHLMITHMKSTDTNIQLMVKNQHKVLKAIISRKSNHNSRKMDMEMNSSGTEESDTEIDE
jgi:hypothetical protein